MNLKVILRNVGFALLVNALFMFFSILVSVANGNDSALAALLISFIMTFSVGVFPFIFVRKTSAISIKDGYMIIILSWLLSFVFGMMPYLLWGGPFTVVNAWFESVSGYTATGFTVLDDVESLPRSLLFWRSSTHFIGGLGVVVFLMLMIPTSSPMRLKLANMELSSLSKDAYQTRLNKIVYIFTYVYLAITASSFILYMIGGMSAFDAINHAFSVVATGGFSTRNASIGAYGSVFIDIVSIVMMFLASVHFALLFSAVVNRSLKPFRNPVFKYYLILVVSATLIGAFSIKVEGLEQGWGKSLLESCFHVASYASTTGFDIPDRSSQSGIICMLLLFLSMHCGMAGSTTGGIKADRFLLLFKALRKHVKKIVHPSSISDVKVGNRIVKDEEIYPHLLFIAVYALVMLVSIALCHLCGNGDEAVTASVASLGNVGVLADLPGAGGGMDFLNSSTKIVLSIDMLLGRLEIFPYFVVLSMLTSKSGRK